MLRSTKLFRNLPARIAALTACIAMSASAAQAATYRPIKTTGSAQMAQSATAGLTFTRIDDNNDPTFNQLLGIDDSGVISGYFGSGAMGHPNQGYTIAPPYNSFIPDNLPTSTQTQATGISPAATTSGFWSPTNLGFSTSGAALDANYGFIRYVESNGVTVWLSVNNPLTTSNPKVNQVLGVNTSLNAVGFYNDSNGNSHGYVYSVSKGTFSVPFVDVNASSTTYTGINNNNTICGFYFDKNTHTTKSFIQLANGANIKYTVPGQPTTQFFGVNNSNEAVGQYIDTRNIAHGIVYNPSTKVLTIVNEPFGVNGTTLNGVNDNHQAVGFYTDIAGNTHGLLVNNIP